ncbi:MAG: alpha/beta fold hydrolase [Gemmatimonadales bacterium]
MWVWVQGITSLRLSLVRGPPSRHISLRFATWPKQRTRRGAAAQDSAAAPPVNREGFVTAEDGARLHYHVLGAGRPTVIVPAGLFLERDLARLAHGRTMVFYDMRGRGRSAPIRDSARVSIDLDVSDLEAVRRHVGAERFVPLGWSYLGMMVMRYAAAHPERVERIVQIGPVSRTFGARYPDSLVAHDARPVTDSAAYARLLHLRAEGLAARDPRADCEREYHVLRGRLVGDQRLASRVPDLCDLPNEWPVHLDPHQRWIFTSFARAEAPSWERFATLRVPVLTIHGTQDRNAPYGGGREWAAHLPSGRLLTVRGAAHMPWLDAPGVVYPALDRFLSGRWPPGAAHPEPP